MNIYDKLSIGLDVTELQSKVIANNIANINTAGYKGKYVSFDSVYDKKDKQLAKDSITIKENNTTVERTDKNNVDLEVEKVNQASTTLQYNGLIELTNIQLDMLTSVIKGR